MGCVEWSATKKIARGDYVIRIGDARTAPPSEIYKQLQQDSHRNTTVVVLQPGAPKPVEVTALQEFYEYLLVTNDENGNSHKKEYARKLRAELRCYLQFICYVVSYLQ